MISDLKDAIEAISNYVDRNYGDLITHGRPLHYTRERFWVAELKSDYPRFIHDDKNPKTMIVKYITLRQLGEVRLTDDNQIDATPRDEVVVVQDALVTVPVPGSFKKSEAAENIPERGGPL